MQLTMDDAMEKLSSLISGRRAPAAETYASAFRAMETYLRVLDISDAVQELSVIHVAGTKGKVGRRVGAQEKEKRRRRLTIITIPIPPPVENASVMRIG